MEWKGLAGAWWSGGRRGWRGGGGSADENKILFTKEFYG